MSCLLPVAFVCYFIVLICIGLYFYRQSKNDAEFIVGGRSLNFWVTAISAQSSDMGAWLFLAFPGAIFTYGLFPTVWVAIGLWLGMYATWHFVAPQIRRATEKYEALTLWTYFSKKFGDTTQTTRLLCASISLIFFSFYIGAGLVGLGRLFESAFCLDYHIGILLGIAITIAYAFVGGFLAVAWCNLFQGIFLLAMIILVPLVAAQHIDGWHAIASVAGARNISLNLVPSLNEVIITLITALGWGLGYFGMPHVIVNFMGIDDPKNMYKAQVVGLTWQVIVLCAAVAIGLIGIPFFSAGLVNPEHLFALMVNQLFSPLMAGFVLCGVLAAILSTLDTQLIVAATSFGEDIYGTAINSKATGAQVIWATRVGMILLGGIGVWIAWNPTSLFDLVEYAWTGMGASFGPTVLLSLYGKNITARGALAGVCAGAAIAGFWPLFFVGPQTAGLVCGFIANGLIAQGVSRLR